MKALEQDIKNAFIHLRERSSREIYFFNTSLFDMYVDFICVHPCFLKKVVFKESKKQKPLKPIVQPSMQERKLQEKI